MPPNKPDSLAPRGTPDNASLLSPIAYDDDASSLHSRSNQDTDSEDDELQLRARNSRELRAHDRIVLMQEEELDRLVTEERKRRGSNLVLPNPLDKILGGRAMSFGTSSNEDVSEKKKTKRSSRRKRRADKMRKLMEDAQHGEDGALMHEMEQGEMKDGSSTGDSSDRDEDGYDDDLQHTIGDKGQSWARWIFVYSFIVLGFAILVLIAWKLTIASKAATAAAAALKHRLISNGTALFGPTTIIISLDGFRADFLQRGLTPRLNALVKEGESPKYMLPSFPSVTFPNHYTLATGLYPEAHGVVGNTFWDPDLQAEFFYTDPARSLDAKWWGGEPFWVTAEKQGVRSAVHMWPGSEAAILHTEPSIVDKYKDDEPLDKKVSRILGFLDMPAVEERPRLIAAYVPDVDSDGHRYGPNSTEIRATITRADDMVGGLLRGLDERNLTHIVNVVVVSDHGMATTDTSRLIQLEDLVDVSKLEHVDGWPLYGLRPKDPADLRPLYDGLKEKQKGQPFDVYLKDEDMPARYHFAKNERIAPLWIVPKTGWAIVTREEFDVARGKKEGLVYHPRGLHGYDHEHPLMRAIFIARGPAFANPGNSEIEVFQNIEVYNLVCDSVGIVPAANNGTLRLPLRPVGTQGEGSEVPPDPVTTDPLTLTTSVNKVASTTETRTGISATAGTVHASKSTTTESSTTEASHGPKPSATETRMETSTGRADASKPTSTTTGGENAGQESLEDTLKGVWEWVKDQFGKAWGKMKGGSG